MYLTNVSILSNTEIGAYSYFGTGCQIGGLKKIGRFCSIAPSVIIGLGNHPTGYLSTHPLFFNGAGMFDAWPTPSIGIQRPLDIVKEPAVIGNDVWIGANAIIGRGVSIGDGAIIGAGSLVLEDVAPYSIVAGSPARLIRFRCTEDQVMELSRLEWWRFPLEIMLELPVNNIGACIPILRQRLSDKTPAKYQLYDLVNGQISAVL